MCGNSPKTRLSNAYLHIFGTLVLMLEWAREGWTDERTNEQIDRELEGVLHFQKTTITKKARKVRVTVGRWPPTWQKKPMRLTIVMVES